MKRIAAIILSLTLILGLVSGCIKTSKPALTEEDVKSVAAVKKAVKSSKDIAADLSDLVDKQIEYSATFVAGYADATLAGESYDATDFVNKVSENRDAVADSVDEVKKLMKNVGKIGKTETDEVTLAVDAAEEYFERLLSCLSDLDSIMTFYLDENKAMDPVAYFNADDYGDDALAMIDGLYVALDDTIINFEAITSCPEYMQESFDIYIDKVAIYLKMLESWYYGIALEDPLREQSGYQLYDRQNVEVLKYEVELYEMIDLQYEKVGKRLSGSIQTLQEEILKNCDDLEKTDGEIPDIDFSYIEAEPEVSIDYRTVETIYPSLYGAMDYVIDMTATSENGEVEVIVTASIQGFTQEYQQKATITEQVTKLLIKPVIITEQLDLGSAKDALLNFSVTESESGKVLVQESLTINLMSIYDFMLSNDEFGRVSRENVLAWMTPESEGILELRRNAISWMDTWSGGTLNSLIGYQDYGVFDDPALNTYLQIVAIQAAISEMGVRYNMGAYSLSEGINQRVLLPDDVLSSGSGICIETSILFATAIQSADMHCMIIFSPGHAQVAVETGYGSGSYYLVETTLLPFYGSDEEMTSLITEFTSEEWAQFLLDPWGDGSGAAYVVDCDLLQTLGIRAISYSS